MIPQALSRIAGGLLAGVALAGPGLLLAQESPGGQLLNNASYTVEAYGAAFRKSYPDASRRIDDKALESWNRFQAESKTGLGRDVDFSFKGYGVISTQEDERRGVFSDPGYRSERPRFVDVSEAKFRWAQEGFDASAGKILHNVGLSNLYSPANRFNNADASNPMHPIETGVWSARADIFVGDDTLAAAVIPWQDRTGAPPRSSRWFGTTGSYNFSTIDTNLLGLGSNATLDIRDEFARTKPGNYGYFAHYRGSRPGVDFFGLAHIGPSIYPVLRRERAGSTRFIAETPRAFTAAGGLSTTQGSWSYYGEASFQNTYDRKDQDFAKYVIGASYRETEWAEALGLEEIMPIVEYAGEGIFGRQAGELYVADSRGARPGRKTILARLSLRQTDRLSYAVGGSRNLEARDFGWSAGVEYKLTDSLKLRGDARLFSGRDNTEFGRWARNDHVEIGVVYKF
ncbi:MAG: hypothetical protein FJX11_21650 [Alphaproteobacteria bacterium]|nr:hypothetical protein [Alphaproteobacteria bacterium]